MKITLFAKKLAIVILSTIFIFTSIACNGNNSSVSEEQQFTWWIPRTDGRGVFYQSYEENPAAQWLNNQKWDSETGTYTSDGSGTKLDMSYMVPAAGTESDNFNTMIATGSYPEIIDLSFANDSPKQLYEDGVLIEITEYVEKYLPDYLAFLDLHPELKPFVSEIDSNGDAHYYGLYGFSDSPINPYQGHMYRRDWVVTYGEPSSHIWDWDSSYVITNGHPEVTPLSKAVAENNLNGWKANIVTEFTSNFGVEDTWEDNVIFPSGKSDPYTISDWEWMFDFFAEAIEAEGFSNNSNAYVTTLYYLGYLQTGDLVSSFGGGGPMWYVDEGGAQFGGTSENFKTYLEAMNNWNNNGWLDTQFETRGSDMFFQINRTGVSQGMVGMFIGGIGYLGTTIRATASNATAQQNAMVFGAPLPMNDVYGDDSNKFKEPDTFYSQNILRAPTGFTSEIEGKDLETLFTMINWLYKEEGSLLNSFGLSAEQYASMEFSPNLYAEYELDRAYDIVENTEGKLTYVVTVPQSSELGNAVKLNRISTSISFYGKTGEYEIDFGYNTVTQIAIDLWTMYENTGYILDYNSLFNEEQSSLYSKTNTYINDTMGVQVPNLIKNGLDGWEVYVSKVSKYGPERVSTIYQEILDEIKRLLQEN